MPNAQASATSDIERISLYVRVASALRGRIARGDWPVGGRLPNHQELAAQYRVSRNTMRQALELLRSEGVIESARGRGTFVTKAIAPAGRERAIRNAISNPQAVGTELRIKVLSRARVAALPPSIAGDHPQCDGYVRINKLHFHRRGPFALIDLYVDAAAFDAFPSGADERSLMNRLVMEHGPTPFASWWQEITVGHPDHDTARLLGCSMTTPLVHLRRRRFDAAGRILLGGDFFYRGDLFVYEISGEGADPPGSKARHGDEAAAPRRSPRQAGRR